jgi:tRNA-Thr(GGU) m(6)t(6)A37 methyltransferase TsaA
MLGPGGVCHAGVVIMEPIGRVSSPRSEPLDDDWGEVVATITVDSDRFSADALLGLDDFSHLEVVFVFDRVDPDRMEAGARRPRGNPEWPEVGIFAQRAKGRPNRVGVSVCRLVSVDGLTVTVRGLDAIDGTPVLDIKPYLTEFAPRGNVRQPPWSHQLMAGYWQGVAPDESGKETAATRRSYDVVAGRYDREIGGELAAKPFDRALLAALEELCAGGVVADIGSGPGHVAAHFAASGVPVAAVDLSPAMCSLACGRGVPAAAADMVALPLRSDGVAGLVCWYAVIHLDASQRAAAYREMRRVLRPGGHALLSFHVSDADTVAGDAKRLSEWWGQPVELTFRFLDVGQERGLLADAGMLVVAQFERDPSGDEHPSRRCYLFARAS